MDVTNVVLETERLILRGWEKEDLADFFEYASVEGVGEMAGWPHHKSIEESKTILDDFRKTKEVFALYHKLDAKVIGSLGVHESRASIGLDPELRVREIGYVLSKDYWNQGLMTEAVRAVIDFCFSRLQLDALTCGHFPHNLQSKRVIEKCGFHYLETRESHSRLLNKTFQVMGYVLMNEGKRSKD